MAVPTKAEEIALVLEEAILSGELAPGHVLRQEELSVQFGVSRTPIREALRQLAALDLVDFAGKRGVRVRSLAPEELFETFTIRAALEGFAASLARDNLGPRELQSMRRTGKRFADLTQDLRARPHEPVELRAVTSDWVKANAEFHDVYLDACGVTRLAEAARSARRVYHGQALAPSNELDELYALNVDQHRSIVDGFAAGDANVRFLVEEHILDSGRLLQRTLEQGGAANVLGRRVSWAGAPG
jgi:DNA-binding GntR family transcriptional regulator